MAVAEKAGLGLVFDNIHPLKDKNRMIKNERNAISQNRLVIKKSSIPGAGKGLFTKDAITKGSFIIEYKGKITTWKKIQEGKEFNGYVYYVNRNHVIDAIREKAGLARYANDAKGMVKMPGIVNNAQYVTRNKQVFIQAVKDIAPGEEILVAYGKEYWDVIRHNHKIDAKKPAGSTK
jgi:uncharacterized protein